MNPLLSSPSSATQAPVAAAPSTQAATAQTVAPSSSLTQPAQPGGSPDRANRALAEAAGVSTLGASTSASDLSGTSGINLNDLSPEELALLLGTSPAPPPQPGFGQILLSLLPVIVPMLPDILNFFAGLFNRGRGHDYYPPHHPHYPQQPAPHYPVAGHPGGSVHQPYGTEPGIWYSTSGLFEPRPIGVNTANGISPNEARFLAGDPGAAVTYV